MKRLFLLLMVLILSLSLVACGGGGDAEEAAPDASIPEASDVTLVTKEANYTTLLVPSDFAEFQTADGGAAVVEGPSSNIVVTNTIETDVVIEDITQDYMISLLESSYSNIEVLEFVNPASVAGVDAVFIQVTGDGATSGKNKTVCYIMMFFSIDGVNCEQHVALTYDTGAGTSLEANLAEIIESISLE